MADEPVGCARPTGSVVGGNEDASTATTPHNHETQEDRPMTAVRVGAKAPDFEAPAFHEGGFTTVKLSEHLGRWVMLCFYPGDFTFV